MTTRRVARVVHLTSVHPIDDLRIFRKHCTALAAAGYRVIVVGPGIHGRSVNGVEIIGVPQSSRNRFYRMIVYQIIFAVRVLRLQAELFHFHDPELIPLGFILKLLGAKVIYDVHEDVPRDIFVKDWIAAPLRRLLSRTMELIEHAGGRWFDGIVTVTPTIASRFPPAKTVLVRNFPIFDEFDISSIPYLERPLTVCYVGVLSSERGAFDMIDAVERVSAGGSEPMLRLGGYFITAVEEARARTKQGWGRTKFEGWLNREQVGLVLQQARAGLILPHAKRSFVEAYPTKIFEYMNAGLPVISCDYPIYREILEDGACGLLVSPGDPAAVAAAIDWIFAHPAEAQAMGERGRRRVRALYSWQTEADNLVQFYEYILGRQGRGMYHHNPEATYASTR